MRILVLNGANLNLLGMREPSLYGETTYAQLESSIQQYCCKKGHAVEIRQSNHEGVLVDWIQQAAGNFDGIILNAAAYTHTSVALLDALLAVQIPTVEVHLTDPATRESFRSVSYIRVACIAAVCGKGIAGYLEAVDLLENSLHISGRNRQ